MWGITPAEFALAWTDAEGAPGAEGLTLHATAPGTLTTLRFVPLPTMALPVAPYPRAMTTPIAP